MAENRMKITMRKFQLKKTHSHGSLQNASPKFDKDGTKFDDWLNPNEKIEKHTVSMEVENYGTNNRYENIELKEREKVNILGGNVDPKQNITSMHETTLQFGAKPEDPEELPKGTQRNVTKTKTKIRKIEVMEPEQEEVKIIKNHFKNQYRIFDGNVDYWKNMSKTEVEQVKGEQWRTNGDRLGQIETKKMYYNKEGPQKTTKTRVVTRVLKTLQVKPKDSSQDPKKQGQSSILKSYFMKPPTSQTQEMQFYSRRNDSRVEDLKENKQFEFESMENIMRQRSLEQLKNVNRSISNFQPTNKKRATGPPTPNRFYIVNKGSPHGLASNDYLYANRPGQESPEEARRRLLRSQQSGYQWSNEVLDSTLKNFPKYQNKYLTSNHTSYDTLQSPLLRAHRSVSPYATPRALESPARKEKYVFPRASRQNKPLAHLPPKQLPLIDELQMTNSNLPLSTYSNAHLHIPSGVNDLLLLLMKKILVYSSKVEGLQTKLLENNPQFNGAELLADINLMNRQFLTLHDMVYFVHCFGFRVSDWEAFRMMCYLSHYTLASLAELIIQENIDETSIKLIPQDYFENKRVSSIIQGDAEPKLLAVTEERPKYYISPADLLELVVPSWKSRAGQSLAGQSRLDQRKVRKREYFLIRQILLLTFRKIEEIGMIIHYIRKYHLSDIFGYLLNFNHHPNSSGGGIRRDKAEVSGSSGKFTNWVKSKKRSVFSAKLGT